MVSEVVSRKTMLEYNVDWPPNPPFLPEERGFFIYGRQTDRHLNLRLHAMENGCQTNKIVQHKIFREVSFS
jgi:hypothetical protein